MNFFVPEAVQTPNGELSTRREVAARDLEGVKILARLWKIPMRTLLVKHEDGRVSTWVFSREVIPCEPPPPDAKIAGQSSAFARRAINKRQWLIENPAHAAWLGGRPRCQFNEWRKEPAAQQIISELRACGMYANSTTDSDICFAMSTAANQLAKEPDRDDRAEDLAAIRAIVARGRVVASDLAELAKTTQ